MSKAHLVTNVSQETRSSLAHVVRIGRGNGHQTHGERQQRRTTQAQYVARIDDKQGRGDAVEGCQEEAEGEKGITVGSVKAYQ